MRGDPPRLTIRLILTATCLLLVPAAAMAKATCASQVDKAALKYATAVVNKAVAACKKSPGGSCFNASVAAIKAKALKSCDTASIATQFANRCISRDTSCAPTAVSTAQNVADCLSCSIKSDVACLTATAFGATLPAFCGAAR